MRFDIDLFRSLPDGEVYVVLLEWESDMLYNVREMMGPLSYQERDELRADPRNWDGDPEFDLEKTTREMRENIRWQYLETLYACA